jgi:RecJ-like exonuclease
MANIKQKKVEAGCPKCEASGYFGESPRATDNPFCPDCLGRGLITVAQDKAAGCPDCKGRGHVENVPCRPCAHTGKIVPAPKPEPDPSVPTVESLTAKNEALKTEIAALQKKLAKPQ